MKRILAAIALLFVSLSVFAQSGAIQGSSTLGGTPAKTQGLNSTNFLSGVIPSATITVFLTGTQTLATITSDGTTPLSNPFTSNAVNSANPGGWIFFAAPAQGYDVIASGGIPPNVYPTPVTLCKDCFVGASGSISPGNPNKPLAGYPTAAANVTPFSPQTDSTQVKGIFKGPRVDVTHSDFGSTCSNPADPHGVLDSTCAIQAAVAYALTQPFSPGVTPCVYFPHGTYKVSGEILTRAPICYVGDSRDEVNIVNTGATNNVFTFAGIGANPQCTNGSCSASISNMTIQGSGTSTTGTLVEIDNTTNMRMDNVKLLNHGGRALVLNNSERGSYTHLNIQFVRWPIIMAGNSNETIFEDVQVSGGSVISPSNTGGQFCYNINCVNGNFPGPNSATAVAAQWAANHNQNVGDFISAIDATGILHNFRLSAGGSVVAGLWVPCQTGATSPAFSSVGVNGTIVDNTCTWLDTGLDTILKPDYHAMVIVNGVVFKWLRGSLKSTQFQGGFNLMGGGGEGITIESAYIEGGNGLDINPAVQVIGGLDEFVINSSALSATATLIPIQDTTWFPKYFNDTSVITSLGASAENYIIYPQDANSNSTAMSAFTPGVQKNQFEVITINGASSDNNVYISANGRHAGGSTSPAGIVWGPGSYIRRQPGTAGSGLNFIGNHVESINLSQGAGYTTSCGDLQLNSLCGDALLGPALNGKDINVPVNTGTGLTVNSFVMNIKLLGNSFFLGGDESLGVGTLKSAFHPRVIQLDPATPITLLAQNQAVYTTLQGYTNNSTMFQAIYTPTSTPAYEYTDLAGRFVDTQVTFASNPTMLSVAGGVEGVLRQFNNEVCDSDFPATGSLANIETCTQTFGAKQWSILGSNGTSLTNLFNINLSGVGTTGVAAHFGGPLGLTVPNTGAANTFTPATGSNNFTGTNPLTINALPVPGFTTTTPSGTCTPNGFIPVVINGVTVHIATCS
jgi:hypothetical protein